jgi:hypothetical protein
MHGRMVVPTLRSGAVTCLRGIGAHAPRMRRQVLSDKTGVVHDFSWRRPRARAQHPGGCFMTKNELLLLADEHFSGFIAELSHEQSASTLHSEHGHDVTREYFAFVSELLRLYGIADPYQ